MKVMIDAKIYDVRPETRAHEKAVSEFKRLADNAKEAAFINRLMARTP